MLWIAFENKVAQNILHMGKYLVHMHNKKYRSRENSKNYSAPTNMTNIQTYISAGKNWTTYQLKVYGLNFHP